LQERKRLGHLSCYQNGEAINLDGDKVTGSDVAGLEHSDPLLLQHEWKRYKIQCSVTVVTALIAAVWGPVLKQSPI
jgi:hypothetical protein